MIKKQSLFVLLLLLSQITYAQDFDVYPRTKDDNINMPNLYERTSFEDFQILSRNIRMLDMAYAAIVPGYIHFKAKDPTIGYSLLGARIAGYAGLTVSIVSLNANNKNIKDIPNLDSEYEAEKTIFYSSVAIIASSYLFDWIHGKYRLEKKQEMIRYKYGMKLKMDETSYRKNKLTPTFYLSYNF